jgi:acyl-CoA synthetase (AMP-forming)/AMP-acid ligase II
MRGYWNLPERTDVAFRHAADGARWYKTGDIVITDENGDYLFIGRRDRMVKKRGYRVELGEIEACLYCHPLLSDAAVIAQQEEDTGVRIRAFLSTKEGARLSVIALKQFCADRLPLYMVPDLFTILPYLPKTSTAKIDYQRLKEMS